MAGKVMHAVLYEGYGGGAAGLKHVEVPVPTPSKGEVLLKLEATSLNPVDWKTQKGMLRPLLPRKFPFIPGRLLEAKRQHLYWTPCAAHCIDLMLEDIGKLPPVKNALKKCIYMNGYIYTHIPVVNMMRKFTNERNLHRPAVTRFATSFITLSQFHKQKSNLRKMVTSEQWNDAKWSKEIQAKKVSTYILQEQFWRNVLYALKLSGPLVKVLRLVDGERKPPMGYIYEAMDRAKEAIAKSFGHKEEVYKKAFEIIDRRWECQLHRPLHAAGYFLNPEFFYDNPEQVCCEEVMKGLLDCIERLVPDEQTQDKIDKELDAYRNATSLFGTKMAIRNRKAKAPATDVAGEVVEIGAGVKNFKPGDKVVAMMSHLTGGGLAEYGVAKENLTIHRPPEVSAAEGAGLPVAGLTAHMALTQSAGLKLDGSGPHKNILVTAASGGVGQYAVQLAKLGNAHVTATCGARNVDLVKSLGADEVLDYKTPEGASLGSPSGKKYDAVVHCAASCPWSVFEPNLGADGKVIDITPGPSAMWTFAMKKLTFSKKQLVPLLLVPKGENLRYLVELVREGKLRTVIDSKFALSNAEDAWAKSIDGHATGKIIVEQ